MENRLFDKGFDMDKFIDRRLVEIENLEERKFARTVLTEIFQEIYHYTQEEYRQLENKIEQELSDKSEYTISIGMIEQKYYDATDEEMFPMREEDTRERQINMDEMFAALEKGEPYWLYSVFLENDYAAVKRLTQTKEQFSCRILTADGEYQGSVSVRPQQRYQELLRELYHIFGDNGIPWKTVCAPYLYKIFDVFLEASDVPKEEQIERVIIDFREYTSGVRYKMIPIWNLERMEMIADVQPEPCEDQIHYKHIVNAKRMDENSLYLVADSEADIYEVEHPGDLFITSSQKDTKKWKMYRLTRKNTRRYDMPLLDNNETGNAAKGMRTQAGVFQFLHRFGYENYTVLRKITFPKNIQGEEATYSMDAYVTEEIWPSGKRDLMLLEFENRQPENYLTQDIMSYLVTVLQREYREYRCIGTFF